MAIDTGGIKRLNYFNSQLLDAADFKAEQTYHLGMRRRHNMFMHTAGVAGGGLQVSKNSDQTVKISSGMAIDGKGREIVFVADRMVGIDAVKAKANSTLFLTIGYLDVDEAPAPDAGGGILNHRRIGEHTDINFLERRPPDDGAVITLAAITLDGSGNIVEIDNSVRALVGSVIDPRSELTIRQILVTGGQRVGASLDVGRNLSVAGASEFRGNVSARTVSIATSATVAGELAVAGPCDLRASVKVGVDLSVASALTVNGQTGLADLSVQGKAGFLGPVGIGRTPFSTVAGLEINKGDSNDIALVLASTGPGFGSGMHLHNRSPTGHLYYLYSDTRGLLVLGDGTPGKDKVLWLIDADGQMNVQVPLRVTAGLDLTDGLAIDKGSNTGFGITIKASRDFATGLQLENSAANGHRYSIYSRSDGGMTIGDETRAARVMDIDATGQVSATFKSPSTRSVKKNLTALVDADYAAILDKLAATPVVRYHYVTEDERQRVHLGVIAEEAPDDIVDSERRHVIVLDYLGFLFAGLKAQTIEIDKIKAHLARSA